MPSDAQAQARLASEVIYLITGTAFIIIGLVALVIAAIRRHTLGVLAVFWLGIWSAMYGIQRLNDCSFMVALLPHWMQVSFAYSHAFCTYLVLVAGTLTFRELTTGLLRRIVTVISVCALLIAIPGIGLFIFTGQEFTLIGLNSLVAAAGLVILLIFFLVPSLARRYTLIGDRRVLLAGAIVFGVEALLTNIVRPFGYSIGNIWGDMGFLVFLLSLGYVAMQRVYDSERRLSSIESELAIARQLQFSILPTATPGDQQPAHRCRLRTHDRGRRRLLRIPPRR